MKDIVRILAAFEPSSKVPQVAWRSVKVAKRWVPAAEAIVLFLCSHLASIAKGDEDFWAKDMCQLFSGNM